MGKKMTYREMKKIVDAASIPAEKVDFFPGSKLLGYGWEWRVYGLKDSDEVVKIPRGVFLEINSKEYFNKVFTKYEICKKYFGNFVAKSHFERRKLAGVETNLIFQKRCKYNFESVLFSELSKEMKNQLLEFAKICLFFMKKEKWMPDLDLRRDPNGVWRIRNLMIDEENKIKLVDFGAYYGVFRMNAIVNLWNIYSSRRLWNRFIAELKK